MPLALIPYEARRCAAKHQTHHDGAIMKKPTLIASIISLAIASGCVAETSPNPEVIGESQSALTAEEIARAFDNGKVDPADLVLAATFDKGDAKDSSGKNHHGRFAGLKTVPTKLGLAMHFPGRNFGPGAGSVAIKHHWTEDLPILVRAMALAGSKLYLIGPPDLVDEEATFEKLTKGDPATQKLLAKQDAALNGAQGSLLLVVDPKTGKLIEKRQLESLPTWDSLAAALGKLYYTTTNGRVVCLGK